MTAIPKAIDLQAGQAPGLPGVVLCWLRNASAGLLAEKHWPYPQRTALAPKRTAATRERSSGIRAWAKDQGVAVRNRGPVPASVIAQYEAATGGS